MNIKVIEADPSKAFVISAIGRQSFREAFAGLFENKSVLYDYLDYTYNPDKIAKSIQKENNVFFLAYLENVPVGFAKVKRDSLNDQIESIAQMELQKIYVLPYYQGIGIGTSLMQAVFDLANELKPDYLWLDTHIQNKRAISIYDKYGFKKWGKYFFTIGHQTFEYHLMALPVAVDEPVTCNHC